MVKQDIEWCSFQVLISLLTMFGQYVSFCLVMKLRADFNLHHHTIRCSRWCD